jgi:hypothetical protein
MTELTEAEDKILAIDAKSRSYCRHGLCVERWTTLGNLEF